MTKKVLMIIASLMLVFPMFKAIGAHAAEPTISVSLYNDIGNQTSLTIKTTGYYTTNQRISGGDRFGVANNVSNLEWSNPNTVILANYLAFADALAATPLAYSLHAPILLTQPNILTPDTKTKIDQLKPKKIIIVGGTGSVSSNIESELKNDPAIKDIVTIERIGGADRFAVSQNIASHLPGADTDVVVNGLVFADALSVAPYAAIHGYPILLTESNKVPSQTQAALRSKSIVVGGTGSVSNTVYQDVKGTMRVGGANRYEVAANVIRQLGMNTQHAFVATGATFADALTGSVLAAEQGYPMLLTLSSELPDETIDIIQEKGIKNFTILGGPGSVSANVAKQLPSALTLSPNVTYTIKSESGWMNIYNGSQKVGSFASQVYMAPYQYGSDSTILVNGHEYQGQMEFYNQGGYVRPVNVNIPYNDYLKGVVPFEMSAGWPVNALKAQAVAARTYSYDDVFNTVRDDQNYQRYGGTLWNGNSSYTNSNTAVDDTMGQVLEYGGKLIQAFYSSSNGGKILSNTNAWGLNSQRLPYSTLKDDPYVNGDPYKDWSYTLHKTQIDLTNKDLTQPDTWWSSTKEVDFNTGAKDDQTPPIINNIKSWMVRNESSLSGKDIKIVAIPQLSFSLPGDYGQDDPIMGTLGVSYIVKNADGTYQMGQDGKIAVFTKTYTEIAYNIRSKIGSTIMRSPYIKSVSLSNDIYTVNGGGNGHGIGMSQYGARDMAAQNKTYQEILSFYYPNADLVDKSKQ